MNGFDGLVTRTPPVVETADPPAEWVSRTRALIAEFYPQAKWATLVVNLGPGLPSVSLPVIPQPAVTSSAV